MLILKSLNRILGPRGFIIPKQKYFGDSKNYKERHGGEIPNTMEELIKLKGVARKTANIILGNAFGIIVGIAVDTHVRRFALKFDLTESRNPNKIEQDLMAILPKRMVGLFIQSYRIRQTNLRGAQT